VEDTCLHGYRYWVLSFGRYKETRCKYAISLPVWKGVVRHEESVTSERAPSWKVPYIYGIGSFSLLEGCESSPYSNTRKGRPLCQLGKPHSKE